MRIILKTKMKKVIKKMNMINLCSKLGKRRDNFLTSFFTVQHLNFGRPDLKWLIIKDELH